jgi:hypothetical protein
MVYRLSIFIEHYGLVGWFVVASVNLFVVVLAWSIPVILFNPWAPYLSRSPSVLEVSQNPTQPGSPSDSSTLDAILAQVATPTPTVNVQPGISYEPGTYLVHDQIQPGFYQGEAGMEPGQACYWARLRDLTEAFESILASDTRLGQFYLEVKSSDMALQVYCTITSIDPNLPQVSSFEQRLPPGMYLVGADILPGRYQGQAIDQTCTWERLSGVDREPNSLILSGTETGDFVIEVQSSDFALSTGCDLERISE